MNTSAYITRLVVALVMVATLVAPAVALAEPVLAKSSDIDEALASYANEGRVPVEHKFQVREYRRRVTPRAKVSTKAKPGRSKLTTVMTGSILPL